jgi:transcriptional regulator with XRE-family HTH domain
MQLNLGKVLKNKGITQSALAEAIDVNRSYVSELVSGKKTPSFEMLERILSALEVTPGELLGADENTGAKTGRPQTYAETDVVSFSWPNTARLSIRDIAPDAVAPAAYKAGRSLPAFGILRGDLVIVDVNRKSREGDLVIANVLNDEGHIVTRFMRRVGERLVPEQIDIPSTGVHNDEHAILGVFAALVRNLPLAKIEH